MIRARFDAAVINAEMGGRASYHEPGRMFGAPMKPIEFTTLGIHKMDTFTVLRIVEASKLKVREENPSLSGDAFGKKVAHEAEKVIRRTQPMYAKEFRSENSRNKNPRVRLLFSFTSATMAIFDTIKRSLLRYKRGEDKIGKLISNLALSWIATSILMVIIDSLKDIYRGYWKADGERLTATIIQRILSPFPFMSKVVAPIIDFATTGNPLGRNYEFAKSSLLDTYNVDWLRDLTKAYLVVFLLRTHTTML